MILKSLGLKSSGEHRDIYYNGPLFADFFSFLFFTFRMSAKPEKM